MSVFISKHPSTCPRVLDATDCPPHNILHDTQKYPLFYDALYYPQYNESVYATAEKFCCWLQLSLTSHCNSSCLRCGPFHRSVAVVFDGVGLSIRVDNISMTFTHAHFESAAYVHCSVFTRFKIYQAAAQRGTPLPTAASCITSRLKDDPRWFSYPDACYTDNLSALSAPVLRDAALRVGTKRSDVRNKEFYRHVG
ncbi:hypothetical protein EV702DRAFT_1129554 [Suillus placidus]|uniref:Uncharacterized protein n=1 Tax=Suillus placidus TaxID=48579 RepID=A0A9P6ZNK8_9AGAM|nr:hypothetical protein EV702DRAFT_1129554 [Suillus placidus]